LHPRIQVQGLRSTAVTVRLGVRLMLPEKVGLENQGCGGSGEEGEGGVGVVDVVFVAVITRQ
jgi:hypothetical protein